MKWYTKQQAIHKFGRKKGIEMWQQQQLLAEANQRRLYYKAFGEYPPPSKSTKGGKNPDDPSPSSQKRDLNHPDGRDANLDPMRNFRFRVKIQPYSLGRNGWADDAFPAYLGFTSVSGMSITMTSIPLQEGGLNTLTHQLPGLASYSPITLQKGVFLGDQENWQWLRRLTGTVGNAGYGAPGGNFRCAVRIDVMSQANNDHSGLSFLLSKAWITTLSYSDLNAGDSALIVEQLTLVHEGMHVDWATGWNAKEGANAFRNYEGIPN